VEKKWANCRFGRGRWTRPSRYPSSAARIYPTYTSMRPLTAPCRRCPRGWRKKRNRYALNRQIVGIIICFSGFIYFYFSYDLSLFFFSLSLSLLRKLSQNGRQFFFFGTEFCRQPLCACDSGRAVGSRGAAARPFGVKSHALAGLFVSERIFPSTKESCDFGIADILSRPRLSA